MNNTSITPVEHKNVRVLTTSQLAEFYGCEEKQLRQNYSNNFIRFIEGKHFFLLEGESLRNFKHSNRVENFGSVEQYTVSPNARSLMLWTERGAARHAKSLNTEKAWEVFEDLEDNYFNPDRQRLNLTEGKKAEIALLEAEIEQSKLKIALLEADNLVEHLKQLPDGVRIIDEIRRKFPQASNVTIANLSRAITHYARNRGRRVVKLTEDGRTCSYVSQEVLDMFFARKNIPQLTLKAVGKN